MLQVGLTGGIGSGKTLVCNILEKLGVPVYYADSRARWLMSHEPGLINGIISLFGKEAYDDGTLDRSLIAGEVFGDVEKLSKLNALVHPAVRIDYEKWVEKQEETSYVVEEAAILFESGASRFLDRIVLVVAPESLRIRRVMERDGVKEEEVVQRMRNQMGEEEKKALSDDLIINDESEMLLPQVIALHQRLITSN